MRAELVRIGNSRGVRIPKPLIEECGFGDTVEIHVEKRRLIIEAQRRPRAGWEKRFKAASRREPDGLLFEGLPPNAFDQDEWEW